MTKTGHLPEALPGQSDDDAEEPPEAASDASRFESRVKLIRLCESLSRGKHDYALSTLGRETGGATQLDLSRECMKTVKLRITEISADYLVEFPRAQETTEAPSVQITDGGSASAAMVRTSSAIETEQEYTERKAEWMAQCEKALEESVDQYISSMVVLVVSPYETNQIDTKLQRIPFMKEPGRKLFVYDSLCKDPADWSSIKRSRRNAFSGTKVAMTLTQIGDDVGDTLAVVKKYLFILQDGVASGRPHEC